MNGPELKTRREILGLTADEAAKMFGVSPRTLKYWEASHCYVPDDVLATINHVDQKAEEIYEGLMLDAAQAAPNYVYAIRYAHSEDMFEPVPVGLHSFILGHALRLRDNLRIVWFDDALYWEWLGDRRDSLQNRQRWATEFGKHWYE